MGQCRLAQAHSWPRLSSQGDEAATVVHNWLYSLNASLNCPFFCIDFITCIVERPTWGGAPWHTAIRNNRVLPRTLSWKFIDDGNWSCSYTVRLNCFDNPVLHLNCCRRISKPESSKAAILCTTRSSILVRNAKRKIPYPVRWLQIWEQQRDQFCMSTTYVFGKLNYDGCPRFLSCTLWL